MKTVVITDIGPLDGFYYNRKDYIGRIFNCTEVKLWSDGWSSVHGKLDEVAWNFFQVKYIPYPSVEIEVSK